jgi:exopolyphosphatase/guanosine-5'-triphosphate,3'-diphosphate pyrophosphatase
MKIAVIDMGTNTFHLLIAEVKGDVFEVLHKEREAVRVGEEGLHDGWIPLEAQKRALNTLAHFRKVADGHQVSKIFATATSAIRGAANGLDLVQMIKDTTDIDVKIITGIEEATYIFDGVKRAMPHLDGTSLIMDIGGGSIEFIIVKDGEAMWMQSFEIGGQRLIENFHKSDPITFGEIQELEAYFEKSLEKLHEACRVFKPTSLIGSSGTFDTLSDIYCAEEGIQRDEQATDLPLSLDHFLEIHKELITKTRDERLAIPGMIEMRVDMIVVASVLITYIMRRYDLEELRGSAYALKEGVMMSILDLLGSQDTISRY